MWSLFNKLNIMIDEGQDKLNLEYKPKSEKPIYDICDEDGNIIKSGKLDLLRTEISVKDLFNAVYVLLILDGDQIRSKKFTISRG